jgi:hypothetical protein
MPGFMPGIHVFCVAKPDVDGRDKPGHDACLFLFDQILTEWRGRRKLRGGGLYISALARKIVGDRPSQRRIGNIMR